MTPGFRDLFVVVEVSGTVVVAVEDGMVALANLPDCTVGIGPSSIGHRIRRRGEYVEIIIVSRSLNLYPRTLIPAQIMAIAHAVHSASTLTERMPSFLRS